MLLDYMLSNGRNISVSILGEFLLLVSELFPELLCLLCDKDFTQSYNNLDVDVDVDVDVVDLRARADASMPASNNNVNYTIYSNF